MSGMRWAVRSASVLVAAAVGCGAARGARGDEIENFYSGRGLTMIVGTDAGGGYDTYSRLLARHIRAFIPGQPAITVQNMPGAGGLIAANNIFNVAKRDGSVIAMFPASILLDGALGNPNVKFDLAAFTPIGNMNTENDNCIVWGGRGFDTTEDIFSKTIITGATGQSSNSYIYPALMNAVLGTKFKLIPGYPGTERIRIMEKGELDAACGVFTSTVLTQLPGYLADHKIRVIVQMGLSRHPAFASAPNALDLARTDEQRKVLALAFSPLEMGRPVLAPPAAPINRAAALQRAFTQSLTSPALISDAERANLELRWFDATRLAAVLSDMASTPDAVKKRTRDLLTARP